MSYRCLLFRLPVVARWLAGALVLAAPVLSTAALATTPTAATPTADPFGLEQRDGTVARVEVDRDGWPWPVLPPDADTVFLELQLEGKGEQPSLRARCGDLATVQYFEPGVRGLRYLNVSPLRAAEAGVPCTLVGARLQWQPGATRIVAFQNSTLRDRRVLVVAPHPDDAEIAAFGVYATNRSDVVTVTAGDAGGKNFGVLFADNAEHYRLKGLIRTWDSITVPFLGGVDAEHARNLGYYDALLRKMYRGRPAAVEPQLTILESPDEYRQRNVATTVRERPMAPTWPSLVADLVAELEAVQPEVIVAPHPFLDAHSDHQFTTVALLDALERWPGAVELYLYTNHMVDAEPFPFGPREGIVGLPPWPPASASGAAALEFSRIASVPVDPHTQKLKILALEMMHDLRPFELREAAPQVAGRRSDRRSGPTRKELERARRYSYFRRAVRPNELFFVLSREDGRRLRERFLGDLDEVESEDRAAAR